MTRVISFTSGKGGVGKTHTVINVALSLASKGKSVLILDADLSLANVDVLLGIHVNHTLEDFLADRKTLDEIIVTHSSGVSIIPAGSGVESMCNLTVPQRMKLMSAIEEIGQKYDYLLVDTPAGIGPDVMFFNSASNEIVCIISADPASLTDAYALIKVLSRKYGERSFHVVVNNVRGELQAKRAYKRLAGAVEEFLQVKLNFLSHIPADEIVLESVARRKGVVQEFPSSPVGRALTSLSDSIDAEFHSRKVKGGMQFFFQQLLDAGAYGG